MMAYSCKRIAKKKKPMLKLSIKKQEIFIQNANIVQNILRITTIQQDRFFKLLFISSLLIFQEHFACNLLVFF